MISLLVAQAVAWPDWPAWRNVLTLDDYNTRIVVLGTTLLGCAAGMVGSFTLLRKRALMGDALSHATLPGIALAFIIATVLGYDGKSLPVLLLGATVTGLLGVLAIVAINRWTRLKEDTALGAVLSVFFGIGVALLALAQQLEGGHAAGLEAFIYGKTSSLNAADAKLIAGAAVISIGGCWLLFKEFKLLCFDDGYAASRGMPVLLLDLALMSLVVLVTIVGLQAVGLILMIALLVIPAAAARFWTERMVPMTIAAGIIGTLSGLFGSMLSAIFSRLPSGATIVLVGSAFFVVSMMVGSARGVLIRYWRRWQLDRSIDRQHLLRAIYETLEAGAGSSPVTTSGSMSLARLLTRRSWSPRRLRAAIHRAEGNGLLVDRGDTVSLTATGLREALRLTRQHRLWELYLIHHADTAPSRVDRDADALEHVLEPEVVAELEALLESRVTDVPASPHHIEPPTAAAPALPR